MPTAATPPLTAQVIGGVGTAPVQVPVPAIVKLRVSVAGDVSRIFALLALIS